MSQYLASISAGQYFQAIAYILAAIIFVARLEPRLKAYDLKFESERANYEERFRLAREKSDEKFAAQHEDFMQTLGWQRDHEALARERDGAINQMMIALATLSSTMAEVTRRVTRVEDAEIK